MKSVHVEAVVEKLDPRERFIVEYRMMADGPDELSLALTDWALQLLEGVEIVMPGTAQKVLKDATREHRYVLQSAGFYERLPWSVTW